MKHESRNKLFDNISYTATSKLNQLIERVRGYQDQVEYEEDTEKNSRWENLSERLLGGAEFQPAEDSEIQSIEEKLGRQLDRKEE